MPFSSEARSGFRKALTISANLIAQRVRSKAKHANVPKVPENVNVGSVKESAEEMSIQIWVDTGSMVDESGRNIGGAAWAYEFGSGLYGPRGKKYLIEPREASVLKFPAKRSFFLKRSGQSLIPMAMEGDVFLPYVEHPGVGERPFLKPAMDESAKDVMKLIGIAYVTSTWEGISRRWNARQ